MINPDRLTVKAGEAFNAAIALARQFGNPLVYDVHLLSALLEQEDSIVVPILQKAGASVTAIRDAVKREMERFPKQSGAQPSLSRELNQVFDKAEADAKVLGDLYVSSEHLLLALAETKGIEARTILDGAGAGGDELRAALEAVPG